jgi:hypothetical protein
MQFIGNFRGEMESRFIFSNSFLGFARIEALKSNKRKNFSHSEKFCTTQSGPSTIFTDLREKEN